MNSWKPISCSSRMRAATCSCDPTSAVDPDPRISDSPAQRFGAMTSPCLSPLCRPLSRCWPIESMFFSRRWASLTTPSGIAASIRSVSAQASSAVSRVITWSLTPKRSSRS